MSLRGRSLHAPEPQIVWDGLGLDSPHSGIGYYGKCLHEALCALGETPIITSLVGTPTIINRDKVLFVPNARALTNNRKSASSRIYGLKPVFPSISYKIATQKFTSLIYHGLSNLNLPCFVKKRANDRFVVTIHDLIPLMAGGPSALSVQMRILMPQVVQIADAIIVPSAWTKNCLAERFGTLIAEKIHIVPNGTTTMDVGISSSTSSFGDKPNDVLSVARGEGYKRLPLIAALAKAMPNVNFILITDAMGLRQVGISSSNLKVLTSVNRNQLVEAYRSSKVFLHPSLYEGWCLPAADAIMAGLFTLYVKGSGIQEVCNYAPLRSFGLSPKDGLDSWIEATTEALKKKDKMQTEVYQTDLPSWQENATKTLKIYRSII